MSKTGQNEFSIVAILRLTILDWYFPLMLLCPIKRAAVIMLVVIPSPMKKMTFFARRTVSRSFTIHLALVSEPSLYFKVAVYLPGS